LINEFSGHHDKFNHNVSLKFNPYCLLALDHDDHNNTGSIVEDIITVLRLQ